MKGYINRVELCHKDELIATHKRLWCKEGVSFDPLHYLALLERKPGGLDFARPLEKWNLPGCFQVLRRRLESDLGDGGTREYIKVLRILEDVSLGMLTQSVHRALSIGATSSDAIRLIALCNKEAPIGLFSLDGRPHLKSVRLQDIDLSSYGALAAEVRR